jgi:hypothetical protein
MKQLEKIVSSAQIFAKSVTPAAEGYEEAARSLVIVTSAKWCAARREAEQQEICCVRRAFHAS